MHLQAQIIAIRCVEGSLPLKAAYEEAEAHLPWFAGLRKPRLVMNPITLGRQVALAGQLVQVGECIASQQPLTYCSSRCHTSALITARKCWRAS